MLHTPTSTRLLIALSCLLALLWAAPASAQECKPWEPGCAFKPPATILSACGLGESEVAPGRCCWEGQSWDADAMLCVGAATCEAPGLEPSAGVCIPSTPWLSFHAAQCQAGYLGDCWRWARMVVPDLYDPPRHDGLPATALGPVLRPLCAAGHPLACAHLGAALAAEGERRVPAKGEPLPQRVEGMRLLRQTCAAGVADGCHALGDALMRLRQQHYAPLTKTRWLSLSFNDEPGRVVPIDELPSWGDKEALDAYKRACDAGHSVSCHRLATRQLSLTDQERAQRPALMRRACLGRPQPACVDPEGPAPGGPNRRTLRFSEVYREPLAANEADAEARQMDELARRHDACLRGDRWSCQDAVFLGEEHLFHHPTRTFERAPIQRIQALMSLDGEPLRAMRCRLGMVRQEDACGVGALLQRPVDPTTADAIARFYRHACEDAAPGWPSCASSELRWWLLNRGARAPGELVRALSGTALDLVMAPELPVEVIHTLMRDVLDRAGLTPKQASAVHRSVAPNKRDAPASIKELSATLRATCLQRGDVASCDAAMLSALWSADLDGASTLRAAMGPRDLAQIALSRVISSAEYWRLRDELTRRCEERGAGCALLDQLVDGSKGRYGFFGRVVDLPGEPRREPTSMSKAKRAALLGHGCDRFELYACASLSFTAKEGRPEQRVTLWRACALGDSFSCDALDDMYSGGLEPPPFSASELERINTLCASWRAEEELCEEVSGKLYDAFKVAASRSTAMAEARKLCERLICRPLLRFLDQQSELTAAEQQERARAFHISCRIQGGREKLECASELMRIPQRTAELRWLERAVELCEGPRHSDTWIECKFAYLRLDRAIRRKKDPALFALRRRVAVVECGWGRKDDECRIALGLKHAKTVSVEAQRDVIGLCLGPTEDWGVGRHEPCEALWAAHRAGKTPHLSERQAELIAAVGCALGSLDLCDDLIKRGRAQGASWEEQTMVSWRRCEGAADAECALPRPPSAAAPLWRAIAAHMWLACHMGEEKMCGQLDALRRVEPKP